MKKTLFVILLLASSTGTALAAASTNALSMNALSMNALSMNALSMNRLAFNRLAFNGMALDEARMLDSVAVMGDRPIAKKKH